MLFNTHFSTLDSAGNRYVIEAIERAKIRLTALCYLESLNICNLDKLLFPFEVLHALKFIKFVSKTVREKTSEDPEKGKRDVLSSLRESIDARTHKKMTRRTLTAESAMLMIAGRPVVQISDKDRELTRMTLRCGYRVNDRLCPIVLPLPQPVGLRYPLPGDPITFPNS